LEKSPVIVIGMHRSGTSLVSRVLSDLGVFMGWRQDRNAEARAFIALNKWLLVQAGAAWDQPEPLDLFLADRPSRTIAADFCRDALAGRAGLSFLGPRGWLRTRSLDAYRGQWGWKDPRNTLTLPLWRDLWPNARVVHVLRNGLDVAASLKHRHEQRIDHARKHLSSRRWHWRASKRSLDAARFASMDGGMSLWQHYVGQARAALVTAGHKGIELRYEDLLRQPDVELARLGRWLGLPDPAPGLESLTVTVDSGRAEAWRQDKEICDEAPRFAGLLADFGYRIN
jgi:hypothetical protein